MLVEIVEGIFVDVVKIPRAGAQRAIVREIAVRDRDDLAAGRFQYIGQVSVVVVAVSEKAFLSEE